MTWAAEKMERVWHMCKACAYSILSSQTEWQGAGRLVREDTKIPVTPLKEFLVSVAEMLRFVTINYIYFELDPQQRDGKFRFSLVSSAAKREN